MTIFFYHTHSILFNQKAGFTTTPISLTEYESTCLAADLPIVLATKLQFLPLNITTKLYFSHRQQSLSKSRSKFTSTKHSLTPKLGNPSTVPYILQSSDNRKKNDNVKAGSLQHKSWYLIYCCTICRDKRRDYANLKFP